MHSLTNAYDEAYSRKRNAALLSDKVEEMNAVTEMAENIKNEEFKVEDGLITVRLSVEPVRNELSCAIEAILRDKGETNTNYYRLMIELDKKTLPGLDCLEMVTQQVIASSYPQIETVVVHPL